MSDSDLLAKLGPGIADLNRVLHQLFQESDRAAAVLLGAELDRALLRVLEKRTLPRPKNKGIPLLRPEAAVGSFGARIEIAYRFGLIGRQIYEDLHIHRKIRNHFAHAALVKQAAFDRSPVSDLIGNLKCIGDAPLLRADKDSDHLRTVLTASASILLVYLLRVQTQTLRVQEADFGDITWVTEEKDSFD